MPVSSHDPHLFDIYLYTLRFAALKGEPLATSCQRLHVHGVAWRC
eukprot:SAG31_NODE_150_length_22290_cov_5.975801_7_plen_45_part_00